MIKNSKNKRRPRAYYTAGEKLGWKRKIRDMQRWCADNQDFKMPELPSLAQLLGKLRA